MTFYLGYNDIPRRALSSTASSENVLYPHQNLFYGGKTIFWQTNATVTSSNITFDLGVGNTASAEYFAVSGLDAIIAQTPGTLTLQLRASTDNFSASDVLILEKASITSADLIGTYSEDLIKVETASTAYRYWRLRITTTNSVYHKLRYLYFGRFFDFNGRSPSYPYEINQQTAGVGFKADAGTIFTTSSGRSRHVGKLTWRAVTDTQRNTFFSSVGNYLQDYPIFFYESDAFDHLVLPDKILFAYAEASYSSNDRWKDVGTLTLSFIEDIIG